MVYVLVAIGVLVALLVLYIIVRDVLHTRRDRQQLHREIHDSEEGYAFLINQKLEVVDTNYYNMNPGVEKQPPYLLGNVLRCQTGTDCGTCGTGFSCKTCPVRYVLTNAFKQKRDVVDVPTTMRLYDIAHVSHTVNVLLNAHIVTLGAKPHMMLKVKILQTPEH